MVCAVMSSSCVRGFGDSELVKTIQRVCNTGVLRVVIVTSGDEQIIRQAFEQEGCQGLLDSGVVSLIRAEQDQAAEGYLLELVSSDNSMSGEELVFLGAPRGQSESDIGDSLTKQLLGDLNKLREFNLSGDGVSLLSLVSPLLRAREVTILGITGRAGSGKTTVASQLVDIVESTGFSVQLLPLDSFFRLSSRDRKKWLAEYPEGSPIFEQRADQMQWWDFEKLSSCLNEIRRGESIRMTGLYNRADGGELTGALSVNLEDNRGALVIVEGVAIAHPEVRQYCDELWQIDTPSEERRVRLYSRDKARRANPEAAAARFRLTEKFENSYFEENQGLYDRRLLSILGKLYPSIF